MPPVSSVPVAPAATQTYRVGVVKTYGTKVVRYSGGGMHAKNRVNHAASSLAMRPDDDLRSIMKAEEQCIKPLEEAKRIDEGPSSTVAFSTGLNDIKIHMTYHGMDSVAYVLVPNLRNPPITITDINDHALTLTVTVEWNLFVDWGSVSLDNIVAFDELIQTSTCELDQRNDAYARKFLRDSVGPVLRSSIDRDLPLGCSGARLLYFIIRKSCSK
jgi:hypothetical protein